MKNSYLFPELLKNNIAHWNNISADMHTFPVTNNQKENDKALILLKKTFLKWLDSGNTLSELKTGENRQIIKDKVMNFMTGTLNIDEWVCRLLDRESYYEVSVQFIEKAKELVKGISFDDIFQALRNIWVIIALQIYMDEEVRLTDAMFAYSMLYPLSDNYLDNPLISTDEKVSFNKRFYLKIHGDTDLPANDDEKLIFSMIDLIESDFPRCLYPDVFKGLLTILDGQEKSLLQHNSNKLIEKDLLEYTFYKGGASVLADAYLVRGTLSQEESMFAYTYGIVLQLADDLQDLDEDIKNKHDTPYNRISKTDYLDDFFKKHQAYKQHFLDNIFRTETEKQKAIKQLLERSLELLYFGGVCDNKKRFSNKFLKEYLSKCRFSCRSFRKLNQKIKKRIAL